MVQFTIENDHIKRYTILWTDWHMGPVGRFLTPLVIPFDHNQRVSALVEEVRQRLLVEAPHLRMTGELYFKNTRQFALDNEAFLKDIIPNPEKQPLHTHSYDLKRMTQDYTVHQTKIMAAKKVASVTGTGDLATFLATETASRSRLIVPDEIIVFAIDTSESMRWPALSCITDRYDDEIWLGQDQEATASRLSSCEKGHLRPKEAITSMPFQELIGVLSDNASFEDLVAVLRLQSDAGLRTCASSILERLQLLYTRERRHYEQMIIKARRTPGAHHRQQLQDVDNRSKFLRLNHIITGLAEYDLDLVKWLCSLTSGRFQESKWRWDFNDGLSELPGTQLPTTAKPADLTLIKVYHGRDHKHLFSYWVDGSNSHPYTSVIFRYWRYMAEEGRQDFDEDVDIWSEIRYVGNGRCVGKLNSHWDDIPHRKPAHGTGVLGPEKLYLKPGEPSPDDSHPEILVLKMHVEGHDYQQRMDEAEAKQREFASRLLVSQTLLDAFIDRALVYSLNTHIGITTFNNDVSLVKDITSDIQDLHGSVESAEPCGDTDLVKALSIASYHLLLYASLYPTARKRIICLSDSLGSASRDDIEELVKSFVHSKVVVDSVSFRANNSALQAITYLTGGDDFVPQDGDEVLAIAQLEPFLSQLQREPLPEPRPGTVDTFRQARAAGHKPKPIRAIADNRRLRTPHPALKHRHQFNDPIIGLLNNKNSHNIPKSVLDAPQPGPANSPHNRNARIRSELRALQDTRHKLYRIYVPERDISFWFIVIDGDTELATQYRLGVWVFCLHMGENYPLCAPDVRFYTPLHHINVNLDGRVCHRLLYQDWTPETTNLQIIEAVQLLLVMPRMEDAINMTAVRQTYRTGDGRCAFDNEKERQLQKHARRSMLSWHRALKMNVERLPEEGKERRYYETRLAVQFRVNRIADADNEALEYEELWGCPYPKLETDEVIRYDVKPTW